MWGSGFRVLGLGVLCLGLRIQGLESLGQGRWRFRVHRFEVQ